MNFFESQDRARRKSGQLIFLFFLAVISLVGLTNLALYYVSTLAPADAAQLPAITLETHLLLSGGILLIIGLATLYKTSVLASGGGAGVATSLGGRQLHADTTDFHERKVLNVVEEMAIASGIPVPAVYVLDDDAINAFAAGFNSHDAVIGLTRGAVRFLTRDELQGVVAHEFSHVLHGDMRINIRLMGVLYGITLIGSIGYFLLRTGAYSRGSRDKGLPVFLVAGLALTVLGYAGTFFGNLIKASVSRQREYLADASAVQYTRNPDGIANALKKIGGFRFGSRLMTGNAAEASHLFIGQAVNLSSMMATHPPLEDRIKRLQPAWDGEYLDIEDEFRAAQSEQQRERVFGREQAAAGAAALATAVAVEQSVLESVGQIDQQHLNYAHKLLQNMREELRTAMRQVRGARAAIFCLLIDEDTDIQQRQLQSIATMEGDADVEETLKLLPMVQGLGIEYRIPIIDLAMPVLKSQYEDQFAAFRKTLLALMQADQRIDLFEWCLHRMLVHHLDAEFGRKMRRRPEDNDIGNLHAECQLLLATLARTGAGGDEPAAQIAYSKGLASLALADSPLPADGALRLKELDAALQELLALPPLQKPRLIKACAESVLADGIIQPQEFELLRAVADSLDVPLPPRLEQQDLI